MGHPSLQNRLANATPIVPQPPCVRAASPHHRKLGAGFAPLPQMAGRRVRCLRCIPSGASARRVCYERRTPTGDYQPSLRSPWLAAEESPGLDITSKRFLKDDVYLLIEGVKKGF